MQEVADEKNNKYHHSHERRTYQSEGRERVNKNNDNNNNISKRAKTKTSQDMENRIGSNINNHKSVLNEDKFSRERKHKQSFTSLNKNSSFAMPAVTDNDKYTKHKTRNKEYEETNIRNNHTNLYQYVRNLLSSMELLYALCRCLTLAEWRVRFPGTPIVNCIALSKCTLFSFCRFYLLPEQEEEEFELEEEAQNVSLLLLQINEYGGVIVHDEMQATHVICRQGNWGTYNQSEFTVKTNKEANVKNENQEERLEETNIKEEGSESCESSSWSSSSSFSTLSSSSSSSSLEEILSSEESSSTSSSEEQEEEQERSSEVTLRKNEYNNKSRQAEQAKKRNSTNNKNKQKQSFQENTISDTDSISSVPSSSSSASFEEMMRNDGLMSSRNVDESVLRERQERRSIALRRSEVAQNKNNNKNNNVDALENVNTPSARAPFTPRSQIRSNATSRGKSASNNLLKDKSEKNKVIGIQEITKRNNSKFNIDDNSKYTSNKRSTVTDDSKGKNASIKQEQSSISSQSETTKITKEITGKTNKEASKSAIILSNTQAVIVTPQ